MVKMAGTGNEVRGSLDRQGAGLLRLSINKKDDSMRLSLSNRRLQSVNNSMIMGNQDKKQSITDKLRIMCDNIQRILADDFNI